MQAEIYLDDESIPLWVRIQECTRLLDRALVERRDRGREFANAEADYYMAKEEESFELLNAGYANTFIQTVIKGRPKVNEAMRVRDIKKVEFENADHAINVFKLKLRVLESEMEREWSQQNRL